MIDFPAGRLADFNGDGRSDILRTQTFATGNALYLSNGDGTFTMPEWLAKDKGFI